MKKFIILTILVLAMCVSAFAQTKSSHKIAGVQAHLMYEENGTLSKDILQGEFALWNVIIGEGDATGHSSSTLVYIVVSTDGKEIKTNPVMQFSAVSEDGKRVNYKKTFEYNFPTEGASKVFVPFLLHDTGCQPITLTAKLVEKNVPTKVYQTMTKKIPFACGE
jgi:hypothetical protein